MIKRLKKFTPPVVLLLLLQLLPLLIQFTMLWITAWGPFHLSFDTVKFWEYLVYGWSYAATVYLLGILVFTKYLRSWWLASAFAWLYFLLYTINAGFVYYLETMIGPYFVWIIGPTSGSAYFLDFITKWIVILIVFFVISGILAKWLIWWNAKALAAIRSRWLVVLSLLTFLFWLAPIMRDRGSFQVATAVTHAINTPVQGAWRKDSAFELLKLAENPLVIFGRAMIVYRLKPLEPHPVGDLKAMSGSLKTWHLPLGPRNYPPLGLKPFNHIIMFGTESLSLDFLAPYNKSLPPDLTPFYASLTNDMLLNYQCVALPTQPGLAVTFNSHPNIAGLLTSAYENSLVKYLDAQGYDTYFLMSGPETFLDDDKLFKKMGFKHVIGSVTWEKDPALAPFIEDRGLMDQKLYDIMLDYLAANRDKKIFIQIMNADTHTPPRAYYSTLEYPPYPASLTNATSNPYARRIMSTIFRHDYDVGQTIQKMRDRNLLTEDTLVIFTADHNFPHNEGLNKIPGYPSQFFIRLPLAFISGQPLPHVDVNDSFSQLDFAPTIMHLLGQPVPDGWWGESIFSPHPAAATVSKFGRDINVTTDDGTKMTVSMDHPRNAAEKDLVTLFNSVYTNPPPDDFPAPHLN